MVHKILSRVRRDDQKWQTRPVTKSSLVAAERWIRSRLISSGENIILGLGMVYHGRHHMVIPSVRVIVTDDDRDMLPIGRLHQTIDRLHEKLLFQKRVGITGMTVLV